jgi:protein-S-isoprenylcysteine O-methyltransferase Ste14
LLIDGCKGATLPVMLWLMWWTKNYSTTATLVTALHGSYGLLWCLKSKIFPDPQWNRKVTVLSAIVTCSWLVGYWGAGFLVIAGQLQLSPLRHGTAIMMYVFGVVLMMCADTQKYFMLSLRRGLIVEGWFRRCRNTNYLGEMLLYASFAVLAQSLLYWTFLLATWTHVFLINIYWKELSLMRKEGWEQYSRTSSLLLPVPAIRWRNLFPVVAVNDGDDDHYEDDE